MPLEASTVKCKTGALYAYVFENEYTGLRRDLFWNLYLECEPIMSGGEALPCSLLCDWLTWPVRRWVELDGMKLCDVRQPHKVESSFYLGWHHPFVASSLALHRIPNSASFAVKLSGEFDLEGFDELDAKGINISVEGHVVFSRRTGQGHGGLRCSLGFHRHWRFRLPTMEGQIHIRSDLQIRAMRGRRLLSAVLLPLTPTLSP